MPQLDKVTFSTQYFWLTVFFFILYFVLVNLFVCTIFTVSKVYKQVNRFWATFITNFNLLAFDDLISKRYSSYILNSSILPIMCCLNVIKSNYLCRLLKR